MKIYWLDITEGIINVAKTLLFILVNILLVYGILVLHNYLEIIKFSKALWGF